MSTDDVREGVREKYGQAALRARSSAATSCCGGTAGLESAVIISNCVINLSGDKDRVISEGFAC